MSNERPLDDYFRRAADPAAPTQEMNFGPAIPVSKLQYDLPAETLAEREIARHCGRIVALVAEHGEEHPMVGTLRARIARLEGARNRTWNR
jgi:hypothetical protein